jgi:hypothetical protein
MQKPPRPLLFDYVDDTLERCQRSANQFRFMAQALLPLMFNKHETLYSICSVELTNATIENTQLHRYLSLLARRHDIYFDSALITRGNQADWLYLQRSIQSLHEDSEEEDFLIVIREIIEFIHRQYLILQREYNGVDSQESVILTEHINRVCAALSHALAAINS